MSFFANNPISLPIVESNNISSPKGTRGLIAKEDGWYDVDEYGKEVKIAETGDVVTLHPQSDWNQTDETKADYIKNKPDVLKANEDLQLTDHSISIDKTPFHEGDVGITLSRNVNLNVYGNVNVDGNDITANLSQLNGVVEALTYHLDDVNNNPHGVTAEQIGAATTSQSNTFTEENIFNRIIRSNGAFLGSYDTYVSSLDGTNSLNVYDELEKIEGKADILEIESNKATALKLTDTKNIPLINYRIYGNANGVGGDLDETTGKYMLPMMIYGKNILPNLSALMDSGVYMNGKGVINNDDGSVTVKAGTNTYSTTINLRANLAFTMPFSTTITVSCVGVTKDVTLHIMKQPSGSTQYELVGVVSSTEKIKTAPVLKGDKIRCFLNLKLNGKVEQDTTFYPQIEIGEVATEYEQFVEPVTTYIPLPEPMVEGDYVDYASKTVVAQGVTYTDVDLPEIITNYPSTSLMCDGDMQVTYKADTTNAYKNLKSELDTLKQAIISLGGTI